MNIKICFQTYAIFDYISTWYILIESVYGFNYEMGLRDNPVIYVSDLIMLIQYHARYCVLGKVKCLMTLFDQTSEKEMFHVKLSEINWILRRAFQSEFVSPPCV